MNFLITAVVSFQLTLGGLPPYKDEIRISDSLVISSEYQPAGSLLSDEAMLISVEHFGILKAEVETSVDACNTRLDALREVQKSTIEDLNARCTERNADLQAAVDSLESKNASLSDQLIETESKLQFQLWLNVGLIVGSTIATVAILNYK